MSGGLPGYRLSVLHAALDQNRKPQTENDTVYFVICVTIPIR